MLAIVHIESHLLCHPLFEVNANRSHKKLKIFFNFANEADNFFESLTEKAENGLESKHDNNHCLCLIQLLLGAGEQFEFWNLSTHNKAVGGFHKFLIFMKMKKN